MFPNVTVVTSRDITQSHDLLATVNQPIGLQQHITIGAHPKTHN